MWSAKGTLAVVSLEAAVYAREVLTLAGLHCGSVGSQLILHKE